MLTFDFLLFYLFSFLAIFSALMVISLQNAVHSVLFLILTFCNVTFLLILLGAEFFAFLVIIVYVGAIAVLFLFVIMMLNIKFKSDYVNFFYLLPIGLLISIFLLTNILNFTLNTDLLYLYESKLLWISWVKESQNEENIITIGKLLYTTYSSLFLISSLILLVSMIGVIVLTLHQRSKSKKQNINFQLLRTPNTSLKFLKLRSFK